MRYTFYSQSSLPLGHQRGYIERAERHSGAEIPEGKRDDKTRKRERGKRLEGAPIILSYMSLSRYSVNHTVTETCHVDHEPSLVYTYIVRPCTFFATLVLIKFHAGSHFTDTRFYSLFIFVHTLLTYFDQSTI